MQSKRSLETSQESKHTSLVPPTNYFNRYVGIVDF
jgi:hypothetical protein